MKGHFKIYLQITTQIHEPIAHQFRKCIKKKKVLGKNESNAMNDNKIDFLLTLNEKK